jgi:hypothetical protein
MNTGTASFRKIVLWLCLTIAAFGCGDGAGRNTAGANGTATRDGATAQDRHRVVVLPEFSPLDLNPDSGPNHKRSVPSEPGKEIRITLEVIDDGTPPLVDYQSIVYAIE